jgi:4-hydroxyphenylpyruvate dioxygenase
MLRLKKSIATISLGGSLPEKLAAIAAAGFDGIEVMASDVAGLNDARAVRKLAAEAGLAIDLFQPVRDFEGASDAAWPAAREKGVFALDLAVELGAPLVLVCSNSQPETLGDEGRMAAQLADLAEAAHQRGLKIGYEALAWGARVSTYDHANRIVERASHPALGLILDSFHVLAQRRDWSGVSDLPAARIFHLQVGDAPDLDVDLITLRRHHCDIPGRGQMDVAGFVRAVLATGYRGILALEVFNLLRVPPPVPGAQDAYRSLQDVERQLGLPSLP